MFAPVDRCWVCDGVRLVRYHQCRFDFREYAQQDPGLHAYSSRMVWLVRCVACGFGQPEELPTLESFFDRMYDQRWSTDWIEREFASPAKDFIFRTILSGLERRLGKGHGRRLLDVGAHVGRFLRAAQAAGWQVEGIELNPATAACAARRTGAPVHRVNAHSLPSTEAYDAITLTDVLEHVPDPVRLLTTLAGLTVPGGRIAVKVPCGRSQWHKERLLATLLRSRTVSLADNLVHVNHFTPHSLTLALSRAGFSRIEVQVGAPELSSARRLAEHLSNALRLTVYGAALLPGAVHTPLALNLQAYAMRPSS